MSFAFRDIDEDGSDLAALRGAPSSLDTAIENALRALVARQQDDGHFLFDLEADAAIPAEYVLVKRFLGEPDLDMERRTAIYLRRRQELDGGWPMLAKGPANISASVRAYLVLRIAGDRPDAPHMLRARAAILRLGGAVNVNVFTRILLAYFGIVPWRAVPAMPVEIMHLPRWSPFHLYRISYWARATLVPLLVLIAKKPRAKSLYGFSIDELFVVPPHAIKRWPKTVNQVGPWGAIFAGLDRIARAIDPWLPRRTRKSAIDKALAFVRPRLNGENGLGAIYPPIANTLMMFHVLGVPDDDPDKVVAGKALDKLVARNGDEAFCQPCLSPIWDSALAAHALMEAGRGETAADALDWLVPHQILDVVGDWAVKRPQLRPGGWAFQYSNLFYPDCDDTAVVALAMDRARRETGTRRYDAAIARAREWLVGMQSANGGWGAYDIDNDATYLNHIPFADHGALLDPPTPDVAARCLSLLGQLGERPQTSPAVARALDYLVDTQRDDGSWFGRWGINHVYGTWSALSALAAIGLPPAHPSMRRGVTFLENAQNEDGGWGEDDHGYALDHAVFRRSESVPSQTAWALIGLMAAGEAGGVPVARGIAWLERAQGADGFWPEERYTGVGFPRVFYLRYDGYPKVFPLLALARWRSITSGRQAAGEMGF